MLCDIITGGQTFFKVRKSANPLFIPLSQIRKFLRCVSPQMIRKRLIRTSQIRKFLQTTLQLCHKTVPKVTLLKKCIL
jgi:hypothetical protein